MLHRPPAIGLCRAPGGPSLQPRRPTAAPAAAAAVRAAGRCHAHSQPPQQPDNSDQQHPQEHWLQLLAAQQQPASAVRAAVVVAAAAATAPPRPPTAMPASFDALLLGLNSSSSSRQDTEEDVAAALSSSSAVDSLKHRLRQRVATRTAAFGPAADVSHAPTTNTAAARPHQADNNDSSVTRVLGALQQRMQRGYTQPGTRPGGSTAGRAAAAPERQQRVTRRLKPALAAADVVVPPAKPFKWASRSATASRSGSASSSMEEEEEDTPAAAAGGGSGAGGAAKAGKRRRPAHDPAVAAVLAASGVPQPVLERLTRDWELGHLPPTAKALSQRLMRFADAAALFGCANAAESILARDASLMLLEPAGVRRKLDELQALLDGAVGPGAAGAAAGAAGATPRASGTAGVVTSEVLALVRSHPGILRLSSSCLHKRLAALQRCLGLASKREAMQVVRWQPRVLSMSPSSLDAKVASLAGALGCSQSAAQELVVKQPLLLNLSALSLAAKTRALAGMLGYGPQEVQAMLAAKPGVLLFASDKLQHKWDTLQKLAAAHSRWREEVGRLSPAKLAGLLTKGDSHFLRLQYVAAAAAAHALAAPNSLSHTLCQPQRVFAADFPGYEAWASSASAGSSS